LAGGVVVPDGGSEGEDALQDADGDAVDGAAAVALEIELSFECVAGEPEQDDPGAGELVPEVTAVEALVADVQQDRPLACLCPARA